ncbi:MAG: TIGR02710 family CRISPR-associated protein [Alphaproteobacteria bacterium]|nr:TIGR02710 family CRISPR-associated protein [Alphaproteobacteria bacterium]
MTKILFLTVGTGNKEDLDKSLFAPLRLSMKDGDFDIFVLLPSQKTYQNADFVANDFKDKSFIEPLPVEGYEDDADKCFEHFNRVIEEYKQKYDCNIEDINVDITRGTKVMSAALYSAGLRHGVYKYRYITSPQRDNVGQVISGTEHINIFNADIAIFLAKVDQAKTFLKSYNFSAIETLFSNEKAMPKKYERAGRYIKQTAQFYSAWHCLDYERAISCCPNWGEATPVKILKEELGLGALIVSQEVMSWIKELNKEWKPLPDKKDVSCFPTKEDCWIKAKQATRIATDLLANGRRQVDMGNYEDAVVRIYRIIEMLGQIYLFNRGYDTARIDCEDEKVMECIEYWRKNNKNIPQLKDNKFYEFSRANTAGFIAEFDKEYSQLLFDMMSEEKKNNTNFIISDKERNNSVLIHGFTIIGSKDEQSLRGKFDKVEKVLRRLLSDNETYLKLAHTINSFAER